MEANNAGMSRAAKKRAKKKRRTEGVTFVDKEGQSAPSSATKKSKPLAEEDQTNPTTRPKPERVAKMDGGISSLPFVESLREIVLCDTAGKANEDLLNLTSPERARCALQHILRKVSIEHFYKDHWEQKPLLIQCGSEAERKRFDGFLSESQMRDISSGENNMRNGVDFNVTRYQVDPSTKKYRRVTVDVDNSQQVWKDHFATGATVRWLRPQQHVPAIHSLLSLLELEWGCMVGANAYLTPGGSKQGFAPHYDDIEALLLQLEGQKRWRVYAPLGRSTTLPRVSSEDYDSAQLVDHIPVLDVLLEAGDVLYMPRGWIHQAVTTKESASLHLTISTMQQWAWADFLELVIPEALDASINSAETTLLRDGLPVGFLDYMGVVHDTSGTPDMLKIGEPEQGEGDGSSEESEKAALREKFRAEAKKRIMCVAKEAIDMLDAACDQMGKRFLSERLPPAFSSDEKPKLGDPIGPRSLCRLARNGIARLVIEDEKAVVYHCADNSLVYQEVPLSPLEYEMDHAPALEQLVTTVSPHWIEVAELHHDSIEDKVALVQSLYDEGIVQLRSA